LFGISSIGQTDETEQPQRITQDIKTKRQTYYVVQLLDGFKTTNDNVNGLMPEYISEAGFQNASEVDFVNTIVGTYSYYTATKGE
jgi:hypothetical protein